MLTENAFSPSGSGDKVFALASVEVEKTKQWRGSWGLCLQLSAALDFGHTAFGFSISNMLKKSKEKQKPKP